jgi:hypothetical protein
VSERFPAGLSAWNGGWCWAFGARSKTCARPWIEGSLITGHTIAIDGGLLDIVPQYANLLRPPSSICFRRASA